MTDNLLYGIFPYVALSLATVVGLYRYYTNRFSYSSLSTQFLENRNLFWGSVPWHYGIILILLDYSHLSGALFPKFWSSFLQAPMAIFITEVIGTSLGFFALLGIIFLIFRRFLNGKVLTVTSVMDWILLTALILQVSAGVYIGLFYRWGSLWYLDTAVPWLRSIGRLSPDFSTISPLPWIVKFHMFNAFVIFLLFPFTRLVHVFTFPITYLWRPYQVVAWNHACAFAGGGRVSSVAPASGGAGAPVALRPESTRRGFLKSITGLMIGLVAAALAVPLIGGIIGSSFRLKKTRWAQVGDINSLPLERPTSMKFPYKTEDAYIRETVTHDVWVIKHSASDVTVFSPICPHLGCHYDWHPSKNEFICPCHGSIYSITGKVLGGPAPRPLDTLPWKLEKEELLVQWETFKVGTPQKIRT